MKPSPGTPLASVAQRLALRSKMTDDGQEPHLLIMTATPIPRTLAMSYYADLDVLTIDEYGG